MAMSLASVHSALTDDGMLQIVLGHVGMLLQLAENELTSPPLLVRFGRLRGGSVWPSGGPWENLGNVQYFQVW